MKKKIASRILAAAMAASLLLGASACGDAGDKSLHEICMEQEICTFKPVDLEKQVITIGIYTGCESSVLESALEARFPQVDIVIMEQAGVNNFKTYAQLQDDNGDLTDIVFTTFNVGDGDMFYDLSAESFTSRYNLSSLNALSNNGKLCQLPVSSTVDGIYYNKTLFEEKGWELPQTLDEFYDLCQEISAQGIRPFVPCLKYGVFNPAMGLSSRRVLSSVDEQRKYNEFVAGAASCQGIIEPYYETLRTLFDRGIITEEDFSSSLTQNRRALYEGKIAMLPESMDMYALYQEENPDCEIEFVGYFTDTPGERWMRMVTGKNMAISRKAAQDPEKKETMLKIFDYLSTEEGQDVLFQCFAGISSLKGYKTQLDAGLKDVQSCIDQGQVYFAESFSPLESNGDVLAWLKRGGAIEEIVKATDGFRDQILSNTKEPAAFGQAEEGFTSLETSHFIADTWAQATGADIALVLHKNYYKGSFAKLYKGEITIPEIFYLRGIGASDYLSTYEITGEKLKELLEHPIVNGREINGMYAFSGLKMEYAPWNDMGENVINVTLADGSELQDDKVYTVAAWATSIDESYISSVVKTYEELGDNVELMKAAIEKAEKVTPAQDGRISLIWQ